MDAMPPSTGLELTVLMPCLNESKTVEGCVRDAVQAMQRAGIAGEVLVVDNGSTDGSPALAQAAGARVVIETNKGYGCALRRGIADARGTYIIMGDADQSYDFLRLAEFMPLLREGYDLVMGNRFKGGIEQGAMRPLHKLGNPLLTGALNVLFGTRIGDAHCGIRGFKTSSARTWDLQTMGMEFASEMLVKAKLHGARIADIAFPLRRDGRGHPSHLNTFRDGWRHLRYLLLMSPSWVMAFPATVLMVLGFLVLAWLSFGPQQIGAVQFDVHMMILGAMCMTVGYQVMMLWLSAKIFGWQTHIVPVTPFARKISHVLTLERGLMFGTLLFLVGFVIGIGLLWFWYQSGFGELDVKVTLRYAIWSLLLLVLGIQTISSSFFLSFLTFHISAQDKREIL